jgi:predicted aconitase
MDRTLWLSELPVTGGTPAHTRSLRLIAALCRVARTDRVVPVTSAHVSGVSYWNLGPAGLEYLEALAADGRVRVPTTLNPCAFWPASPPPWVTDEQARLQARVLAAYEAMGVTPTCSCAPYLTGPAPLFGEHLAWAESSAVTFANSLLGARTEREGGPGALAAALCGFTPYAGLHREENRRPRVGVRVTADLGRPWRAGLLGAWLGRTLGPAIPLMTLDGHGVPDRAGWQALAAALVTYGGASIFHVHDHTPEAAAFGTIPHQFVVTEAELDAERSRLVELTPGERVDLVFTGCPHGAPGALAPFPGGLSDPARPWSLFACGARPTGESPGATAGDRSLAVPGGCPAVSPLPEEVRTVATDSAKAAFYLRSRGLRVGIAATETCAGISVTGRWPHAL